jgi:4-hydroxyacetophenone monooxygenase
MTVPGFPNLFLLYGPNTNIVVNGSAIFFTECQVTYLLDAARRVLEAGACALDCRPEVHDAFRAQIDDMNGRRAWGCAGVRNWYTNAAGRVSQNWPGTALEYWSRTRTLDPADYHLMQNREDTRA